MQMLAQHRRLTQVRQFVDQRYAAQQQDGTPTPLPPADYVAPAYRAGEP